jgi:hypothetical protein
MRSPPGLPAQQSSMLTLPEDICTRSQHRRLADRLRTSLVPGCERLSKSAGRATTEPASHLCTDGLDHGGFGGLVHPGRKGVRRRLV